MTRVADLARSTGWMSRGACHGEDPELFFPVGETLAAQRQIDTAKMVCGRCGVRALCLAYVQGTEHEGIWGGTTARERAAARRRARARSRTLQAG
jgi:WhiB family transcriptional regulator, redox-sensing transcriptional regulator